MTVPAPARRTATRRTWAIIAAVVLGTVLLCSACFWGVGVTVEIGKLSNCVYAPHVCDNN